MILQSAGQFRQYLLQFRREIADNAQHLRQAMINAENRQGIGSGREDGDFAMANHGEHLSCRRVTYQARTLLEIDSALNRINDGSFGICDECGDEIQEARLRAVPFAKLCIDCQEQCERSRLPF